MAAEATIASFKRPLIMTGGRHDMSITPFSPPPHTSYFCSLFIESLMKNKNYTENILRKDETLAIFFFFNDN